MTEIKINRTPLTPFRDMPVGSLAIYGERVFIRLNEKKTLNAMFVGDVTLCTVEDGVCVIPIKKIEVFTGGS